MTGFQARALTSACLIAIGAWQGRADYLRGQEEVPAHVRDRRKRAVAHVRNFLRFILGPLLCIRAYWAYIFANDYNIHMVVIFFVWRLAFCFLLLSRTWRHATLLCVIWVAQTACWTVSIMSDFQHVTNHKDSTTRIRMGVANCIFMHYIVVRLRETRLPPVELLRNTC